MTVNPLPPQAYTKETLQKAYAWLLNQSASVKDLATTQDMLISLYLKAQRNGEASLDTPSIQNFKQELKNLASMIGDLQTPPSHGISESIPPSAMTSAPQMTKALPVTGLTQTIKETEAVLSNNGFSGNSPSGQNLNFLDAQSLLAISEVRQNLNLSSDTEALRALISLGYKQYKKI